VRCRHHYYMKRPRGNDQWPVLYFFIPREVYDCGIIKGKLQLAVYLYEHKTLVITYYHSMFIVKATVTIIKS